MPPRVTLFGPNPLLTVTIEARAGEAGEEIHLHAGGQGVWAGRSAAALGAEVVLCGFIGSEAGDVLTGLLAGLPGEQRLVPTAGPSGCYVIDRRGGERELVAQSWATPPSRHEVDDLLSTTCACALGGGALVVCNSFPGDSLPLETYATLVSDVRTSGTPVLVDLSSPRLDSALEGRPDVVKLNDWELAAFVDGPVDGPRLLEAAQRLREAGAGTVVVTRGEQPALVLDGERILELVPPRFERGFREGCGDAMAGAMAAELARGAGMDRALVRGAAAGAATFLRRGLGTGAREVVDQLAERVELRELS
jgi:1-phosphofructokinase